MMLFCHDIRKILVFENHGSCLLFDLLHLCIWVECDVFMSISHQLKLFHIENPLSVRFGADFFRSLPSVPGVYFFYGREGELLYIGQSLDLKARIGSYRHVTPEKNPKRTLKLMHHIVRIEWKECATQDEAIELERVLLLEHLSCRRLEGGSMVAEN